jgi:hypothetical protein
VVVQVALLLCGCKIHAVVPALNTAETD